MMKRKEMEAFAALPVEIECGGLDPFWHTEMHGYRPILYNPFFLRLGIVPKPSRSPPPSTLPV